MIKKTSLLIFLLFKVLFAQTQNELWGMTTDGGDGLGTIFKTDQNGNNQTVVYKFGENHASNACGKLFEASNGKLYGLSSRGGASDKGTLFEYDVNTKIHIKKFDFNDMSGRFPYGSLIEGANGKLYGLTSSGGANSVGTLFEFDFITNMYAKKIDFLGSNGAQPFGSLMKYSNGKLYGLASGGGTIGLGVLFEYDINLNALTVKYNFKAALSGENPYGSLVDGQNGKLYGVSGGDSSRIVFQFDILSNVYTQLYSFISSQALQPQQGDLLLTSNGKMYGTLPYMYAGLEGILFEINLATDVVTTKKSFVSATSGSAPEGAMVQATNGKLYGLTKLGGSSNYGCIYEYDIAANSLIKKSDFTGSPNGIFPRGSMIKASNGKIYGMTSGGGVGGFGLIFEYDEVTNLITNKISFNGYINGTNPFSDLFRASNGKLYGMTIDGGLFNYGVLFEFDPLTNLYTKKLDFDGIVGRFPAGTLMEATNGKLYGYSAIGGAYGYGVLFEYDYTANSYTVKHNFNGYMGNGGSPGGKLIQAFDGKLYGLTPGGSGVGLGSLFTYDIVADTFIKKYTHSLSSNGTNPTASLIQVPNGKMYGLTSNGGTSGLGTLFEYDPTNAIYTKKIDFVSTNGKNPTGSLILATNGKIYGLTNNGGTIDRGTLFEYDYVSNVLTKKINVASYGIYNPGASLVESTNGKLYGLTKAGGTSNLGAIFEYDFYNSVFTKILDFNGLNGGNPFYNSLISNYDNPTNIFESQNLSTINLYPNPASKYVVISDVDMIESVQLLTLTGQVIIDHEVYSKQYIVNLELVSSGVFIVKIIRKDKQVKMYKLIVQK